MHVQLVVGHGLSMYIWAKKWKASSFTHWLESIFLYCHGLLNCSGAVHYCRSSILSEFCDWGSKSAIYDRLISRCWSTPNAIAWLEWCFFRLFRCYFCASYNWNSRLHIPSHWPPPVLFPLLCMGNGRFTSISMGLNRTKTSPFFWLLVYNSFGNLIWLLIFLSYIYNTICMSWISSCKTWQLCRKQ